MRSGPDATLSTAEIGNVGLSFWVLTTRNVLPISAVLRVASGPLRMMRN
jgi:hypothetical protein